MEQGFNDALSLIIDRLPSPHQFCITLSHFLNKTSPIGLANFRILYIFCCYVLFQKILPYSDILIFPLDVQNKPQFRLASQWLNEGRGDGCEKC